VPDRRPVFLSPHYDDAALSCGGTLAALADAGENPLILTVFGGEPSAPLSPFSAEMHVAWGLAPEDAIAHRRQEERCAAQVLGVESRWLELPDAIYRGERYLSDDDLFGPIHPEEATLYRDIRDAIFAFLAGENVQPERFYCPLGVGDHVDHQHVLAVARSLTYRGYSVLAWDDYPYAGSHAADVDSVARIRSQSTPVINQLAEEHLDRRIRAIECYASQHAVIFRELGNPGDATRTYATTVGNGIPAERFWPIYGTSSSA
jgi:LmbE family N-acetylglucosaminyl deacetylase